MFLEQQATGWRERRGGGGGKLVCNYTSQSLVGCKGPVTSERQTVWLGVCRCMCNRGTAVSSLGCQSTNCTATPWQVIWEVWWTHALTRTDTRPFRVKPLKVGWETIWQLELDCMVWIIVVVNNKQAFSVCDTRVNMADVSNTLHKMSLKSSILWSNR